MFRGLPAQPEPVVDLVLCLLVAVAERPQGTELGEQPEAQVATDGRRINLHPEIDPAKPTFALRQTQDWLREEGREQLAKFFNAGLEKVVNGKRLAVSAQFLTRNALHAGRRYFSLRNTDDVLVGHSNREVSRDFLQ